MKSFVIILSIVFASVFANAGLVFDTTRAVTGEQAYRFSPAAVAVAFAMNAGNPAIMVEFDHLGTRRTIVFHSRSVTQMGMSVSELERKIIHAVNANGVHLQIDVMEVGRTIRSGNIIEVERFAIKTEAQPRDS